MARHGTERPLPGRAALLPLDLRSPGGRAAAEAAVAVAFPSLAFFEALRQRTIEDSATFEKLGYCDTSFGVAVDDALYSIHFEVYDCVGVEEGGDRGKLDFVLSAPRAVWNEMIGSIVEHGGAGAAHTINTLSHVGDVMKVEYEDAEGHDRFYRYMASIQEFFDQARHLDVEIR
jgi:hypothetical protein